ncbi:MAG: hypothetical protein IH884_09805 [Myxococcales bacterium]|nr:hypothetical protein [Myxococcales bacterium]
MGQRRAFVSFNRGGSSSYSQALTRASTPGSNARFDVPTLRGLYVTRDAVVEKTATGFRVAFSEAAPGNAKIDWQLIR